MYLLKLAIYSQGVLAMAHLHSTMYLLKPERRKKETKEEGFTFHYVSIKTIECLKRVHNQNYLHSTMYLLKRSHSSQYMWR